MAELRPGTRRHLQQPRPSRRSRPPAAAVSLAAASPFLLAGCIFTSLNPSQHASFSAVAALSKSSAWAVGSWSDTHGAHDLIEHWDGNGWRIVAQPAPGGTGLASVTAINASNVWAVGGHRTLHFGGLGWRQTPTPAGLIMTDVASSADGTLRAVALDTALQPVVLAGTAAGWQPMVGPPIPATHRTCDGGGVNFTLAVVNAGDMWAAGSGSGTGANASAQCAYTAHWNGTAWTVVPTPAIPDHVSLASISARGPRDVWAVGTSWKIDIQSMREIDRGVLLHWDGATWKSLPDIDNTGWGDRLNSIDATPAGVWVVGSRDLFGGFETNMVIKRWSGSQLIGQPVQRIATAGTQSADLHLSDVAVRDGVVVSVGGYSPSINVDATLVDRRNAN